MPRINLDELARELDWRGKRADELILAKECYCDYRENRRAKSRRSKEVRRNCQDASGRLIRLFTKNGAWRLYAKVLWRF